MRIEEEQIGTYTCCYFTRLTRLGLYIIIKLTEINSNIWNNYNMIYYGKYILA